MAYWAGSSSMERILVVVLAGALMLMGGALAFLLIDTAGCAERVGTAWVKAAERIPETQIHQTIPLTSTYSTSTTIIVPAAWSVKLYSPVFGYAQLTVDQPVAEGTRVRVRYVVGRFTGGVEIRGLAEP